MKKLLAFILTLSLLAGVLPLAAATETATEKYEFKFTPTAINKTENTNLNNSQGSVAYGHGNIVKGGRNRKVTELGGKLKLTQINAPFPCIHGCILGNSHRILCYLNPHFFTPYYAFCTLPQGIPDNCRRWQ